MNDLVVVASRYNPAVAVSIVAAVCLVLFFVAAPFEKRHRMDPFVRYDKEDDF